MEEKEETHSKKACEMLEVIFIVEEVEFRCLYSVVFANSSVLAAICKSEKVGEFFVEVKLPWKEKVPFRIFIDMMYPLKPGYELPIEDDLDRPILKKVLRYAGEYKANGVISNIDQLLATNLLLYNRRDLMQGNNYNIQHLRMAEKYNLTTTKQVCINYLSSASFSKDEVKKYNNGYKYLSKEAKYDILTAHFSNLNSVMKTCSSHYNSFRFREDSEQWKNIQFLLSDEVRW